MAAHKIYVNTSPIMSVAAPEQSPLMDVPQPYKPMSTFEAGRALPGFPNGWFAVGFSHELLPAGILSRQCMGQELVLFRTRSGRAWAMDAYCPHMGAHFGHGGTVEGELIRCPFHGFCFDQRGTCVATGYGTRPPPTARVGTWPLREVDGLLLIYYDGLGKEPAWEIPGYDWKGWTSPRTKLWRLHTHPQETTENSVDIGHFRYIHGYQSIEQLQDLLTEGPHLSTRYAMRRPSGFFGKSRQGVRAEFEIHVYGLGYSFVEVSIPVYGLRTRHLVCATPIEQGLIELRISVSLHKVSQPQQINPLLWLVPHELFNRLVSRQVFHVFVHDLQQDFEVWEHKRYIHPPALASGDGPVGKYRTWARQFYPRPATETLSHASLIETA
ncbi:MAG TPA: Rieske 2Fe-2S domain-containing protein [Ktedonobacteraceae bacterium]|nr:Rieske 2Fe-2S domain-containing protein [Ktedonobacteraceae bacterium]